MSSPARQTIDAYVAAMNALSYDGVVALLADDGTFTQRVRPASLAKSLGTKLDKNREEFMHDLRALPDWFEWSDFKPHEVIEAKDQEGDIIFMHASATGKTKSGGAYANEYHFVFRFMPDGNKIRSIDEFAVSAVIIDFMKGEMERQKVNAPVGSKEGSA